MNTPRYKSMCDFCKNQTGNKYQNEYESYQAQCKFSDPNISALTEHGGIDIVEGCGDFEPYLRKEVIADAIESGELVPVVHGRWIQHLEPHLDWVEYQQECSACHNKINGIYGPDYCPNCGAKMDLEDEK